jgi:diadenylate cyclase
MFKEILSTISSQAKLLNWSLDWLNVSEVLIIIGILIVFYIKYIRNKQSEKLIKGIIFLAVAWAFSEILIRLNLNILGMFIRGLVAVISVSLIVIFQPELRRFLGYLGQGGIFNEFMTNNKNNRSEIKINIVKEIIEAVKYLSKNKVGALMLFQNENDTYPYLDVGTVVDAEISTELILTIFHTNTPLHDGAMVIKDFRIHSAGVLLPLTEDPKLSWKYGTRHRAAIGITEVSDSACLVVSEETGDVSISMDGVLKKYEDLATLKADLEKILRISKNQIQEKKTIFKIDNLITIKKNKHKD